MGGRQSVLIYLTNIFNILKTKQFPDSLHEVKIVILFKKRETPKTPRTISLQAPCHTAIK